MQLKCHYSHLNGEEYLLVHHPALWEEVKEVIDAVDAEACRTKVSEERGRRGVRLFSPVEMNRAFKLGLQQRGWSDRRSTFRVAADEKRMRGLYGLPEHEQKRMIHDAGYEPMLSYNQTDFVKNRVAVEIQFGK